MRRAFRTDVNVDEFVVVVHVCVGLDPDGINELIFKLEIICICRLTIKTFASEIFVCFRFGRYAAAF